MFLVLFLLTLSIFDLASAYNAFIQPPREGVNVSLNSDVVVKWQCDDCGSSPMNLSIFQDKHDGTWNEDQLLINVVNQDSYTWKAHTLGLPLANGFHFTFRWADKGVDSGALFIRDGLSSSSISVSSSTSIVATSSVAPSSTPVISSSSFTTSTTSNSATPASTTSSAPVANADSGKKDNTLKVGLGVGIGLGVPLLLTIGGIIGFILFKRRSRQAPTEPKQEQEQMYEAPVYEVQPHNYKAGHQIQELPHEAVRSELPDSQVQDGRMRP